MVSCSLGFLDFLGCFLGIFQDFDFPGGGYQRPKLSFSIISNCAPYCQLSVI